MSVGKDLLDAGFTSIMEVFDGDSQVSFTVDGVDGTFEGLQDPPGVGMNLTLGGMQETAASMLHVSRGSAWTPTEGVQVSINSTVWLTGRPQQGPSVWSIPLSTPNA